MTKLKTVTADQGVYANKDDGPILPGYTETCEKYDLEKMTDRSMGIYEILNGGEPPVAGMITPYQFRPPWLIRVSWNRIVTDYDRDTDVLLGGIGFRF